MLKKRKKNSSKGCVWPTNYLLSDPPQHKLPDRWFGDLLLRTQPPSSHRLLRIAMDSCPGSEHHVCRCLTETGREYFPCFSLSQKGRSLPDAPADTPSVPIAEEAHPRNKPQGMLGKAGWRCRLLWRSALPPGAGGLSLPVN